MKKTFKKLMSVLLVTVLALSNALPTFAADGTEWYVASSLNNWNAKDESYKMTLNEETGLYEITLKDVSAGTNEFKVTNGTWDNGGNFGDNGNNVKFTLVKTGNVLITFNAATEKVNWSSDAAESDSYRVAGDSGLCGSRWDASDDNNLMSYSDTAKRYEKVYTGVAAGTYDFKIVKNGSWDSCYGDNNGNNVSVTVEKDNSTVVVWYNLETGKVGAEINHDLVIKFYYHREDGKYDNWSLWNWDDAGTASTDTAFEADADGNMVATYVVAASATQVGFIVRDPDWNKDISDDRYVDVSSYVSGILNVYIESGQTKWTEDDTNAVKGGKIKSVASDGDKAVTVTATAAIEDYENAFAIKCESEEIKILSVKEGTKENTYVLECEKALESGKVYTLEYAGNSYAITVPSLYKSDAFIKNYTYEGDDLGATWSKESTTFKVWAPTASDVKVNLYESGTEGTEDLTEAVPMTQGEQGVWEVTVEGDLNGTYYTYAVTNGDETVEACDPYARTTGINGNRAMVIDLDSTDPEGWEEDANPNADLDITDAAIYELHVRDASIDESSGVSEGNRGKYLGLTETGTTTENGTSTVLDHMIDLGVTHVQLMPIYDYGSVDETTYDPDNYNWGYDPQNYNVPEGSYSSDPYNGEVRVSELKEMIQTLHENNMSVIMDVVYNHVYDEETFCFNQIVPNYFSRVLSNGDYSNNSGCGNDTATEHVMVRKYIVDSINYWVEEYHINGFRFDLVGLIDTDTINEVMKTVWKTHPDVIFYGEGWSMNSYDTGVDMTTQTNASLVNGQANNKNSNGFAFFNDTIRNANKGNTSDASTGYISGATGLESTIEKCFVGLAGDWCKTPTQSINYNSCHDNYTLYDKLKVSRADASDEDIVKMNKLAAAINYTSQGVPMMLAGEEFLRSKPDSSKKTGYNENSYNAGDTINSIKWDSLDDETLAKVNEYYKGLIAFRKAHAALRLTREWEVGAYIKAMDGLDANVTAFEISGDATDEDSEGLFVIFNPNTTSTTVTLPDGEWDVYVDAEHAGTEVLDTVSGEVKVDAISAMVLVQEKATSGTCGDNLTWTIEDGTLTITGTGAMNDYDGASKLSPFRDVTDITKVVISEGVTSIGNQAFAGCKNLKSIEIPKEITSIGNYAFLGCRSLESVEIPEGVTSIGFYAFSTCTSLKSVVIPKELKSIGNDAFYNCENLTIYSARDSYAEKYAKKNDISFVAICQHEYKTTITKATTSKDGLSVTECSVCGNVKSKTTIYRPKTVTLSTTSYTYNGKVKKPSVTVKDSKGKTISSSNYTVTYASGCKNVGTYKVTIKLKGNYSGTLTKTFKINPAATSISKLTAKSKGFTAKWTKKTTQVTGYQIQYSTSSSFSNAKKVTISKNSTTSKTISKLAKNKKYYVRIRTYKTVNGTKYYSSWSSKKSIKTK